MIVEPNQPENIFLDQLTRMIFAHKTYNKWVLKLKGAGRFSRGMAFLETDSLKILK